MSRSSNILYVLAVSILAIHILATAATAAADFPVAPPDASAATGVGLRQMDVAALAKTFSGTHVEQDASGKVYRVRYGADGSVILSNSSGLIDRGTFSIIRQHGGGVCLRLEHQMNQRMCAMWFFAGDGLHLFGYNPADGTLRAISRPAAE